MISPTKKGGFKKCKKFAFEFPEISPKRGQFKNMRTKCQKFCFGFLKTSQRKGGQTKLKKM